MNTNHYIAVSPPTPRSRPVYHMALWGSQMSNAPGEGDISQPRMGKKIDDRLQAVQFYQHCMPLRFFGSFRCLFLMSNSRVFADGNLKQKASWRRGGNCLRALFYFWRKVHNSAPCNVCKMIISSKGGKDVKQYPDTLFSAPWVSLGKTQAYVTPKEAACNLTNCPSDLIGCRVGN